MTVYFVQRPSDGSVKIGCCEIGSVWKRIAGVQVGQKQKLEVIGFLFGNQAVEKALHQLMER